MCYTLRSMCSDYRILRRIGKGGMSEVFEAEASDGKRYALKKFRNENGARFLEERFRAEARLLQTLYHPGIVRVYDYGYDAENSQAWYVMDLVTGEDPSSVTLADICRNQKPSEEQLRRWFEEIKDALRYLHSCGVVHRDVKLENILIDREGRARLADFGVSRIVNEDLKKEVGVNATFVTGETTGTRPVMGTYFYLPAGVRAGKPATAETDFYALGVAFFRLLTGMWYEQGTDGLDLLAPFPDFWKKELPAILSDRPAKSRSAGRRRPAAAAVAAAGVICAVAWGAVYFLSSVRSDEAPDAANREATSGWALPGTFATPRIKSLSLGGGFGDIVFCACPAGSFMMSNFMGWNGPSRKVNITRPFWIAAAPATAKQFLAVKSDKKLKKTAEAVESAFPDMDAGCVVWHSSATNYLAKVNALYGHLLPEGYEIRLPTEAELEYAITQGGVRPLVPADVYPGADETKRLAGSNAELSRFVRAEDIRLYARNPVNAWGLTTGWTQAGQLVLDLLNERKDLLCPAEETDPWRYAPQGRCVLLRRNYRDRIIIDKPRWVRCVVRLCIGPKLNPNPLLKK